MDNFRPNGLAAVLLLALTISACSKDEAPAPAAPVEAEETESDANNGAPTQPSTPTITADPLPGDFSANQDGFAQYVGADKVFFMLDSSELTSSARQALEKQAEFLRHYGRMRVAVEGHCDERGTREYNLALGERRATAVKDYLIALGVRGSRIQTVSYGKERPLVSGSGESVWSQNRRAATVISR